MPEELLTHPLFILVLGVAMLLAMLAKTVFERFGLPALIGFLIIGFLIGLADSRWGLLNESGHWSLELLGELGVICILFRVGLENDPRELLGQLPHAVTIWLGNVVLSAGAGFVTARYWLRLDLIPSLFIATALSATSVGVSVLIWNAAGRLRSRLGQQLMDVAELDDLSAVVLMIVLFTAAPVLRSGGTQQDLAQQMLSAAGIILLKALGLGIGCYVFARYAEKPITAFFQRFERASDPVLSMIAVGFIIAAIAGYLGFSVAVGALFAGLAYSRDPKAVKLESSFLPIYEWLTPFFFISIGLAVTVDDLVAGSQLGLPLLAAAIIGKTIGAGIPTWWQSGRSAAVLLGISLVPRAEIALVIARMGKELGSWAVSDALYSAMVLVSAATCLGTPLALRRLLTTYREPQ